MDRSRRGLSLLELPSEFASEVDTYRLHPSLLDMATGSAMFLINGNESVKYLYVPVFYGSVAIFGELPATCYAHARTKSGVSIESPLATFDISILDRDGNVVVEIGDFAVRQIRDVSLLESTNSEPAKVTEGEEEISQQRSETISLREGALAFQRVLASPPASSVIIFPSDFSAYVQSENPRDASAPSERCVAAEPIGSNDAVETTITRWWKELLGVDRIGIRDNFFDLGGQSLTGVRLLAKVKKTYGVDLKLATLFSAPTIEKLCALIRNQTARPSYVSATRSLSRPLEAQSDGVLTEIRRGGPRNLFLVHDGEGEILLYLNLRGACPMISR